MTTFRTVLLAHGHHDLPGADEPCVLQLGEGRGIVPALWHDETGTQLRAKSVAFIDTKGTVFVPADMGSTRHEWWYGDGNKPRPGTYWNDLDTGPAAKAIGGTVVAVGGSRRDIAQAQLKAAVAVTGQAASASGQLIAKATRASIQTRALRGDGSTMLRPTAPVLLVAAGLLLAACGTSARRSNPGSLRPTHPAGSTLCGSVSALDRLVVRRSDPFPQNHMHFSFPTEVTVTSAIAVRAAAQALCALPKMPSGAISCPADFGIAYQFVFFASKPAFPTVELDPSGCQVVRGLGPTRWAVRSPHLWPALGSAMGLASPSYGTFRGNGPNG